MGDAPRAKESPQCVSSARGAKTDSGGFVRTVRMVVSFVKGEMRVVRVSRWVRRTRGSRVFSVGGIW